MKEKVYTGGCRCGDVSYSCTGEPYDVGNCHCIDCQKSSGAPFITWATYKLKNFTIHSNKLKEICLNEGVTRGFCEKCGTNLTWQSASYPNWIVVSVMSIDEQTWKPEYESHLSSKVSWVKTIDNIPHYSKGPKY